jgi:type IV pilus assembly protein PilW
MSRTRNSSGAARGFSLIELLVAMAIGLILTLVITMVMTNSEGTKRTITSVNDSSQTGAFVSYLLDRAVRSAGSGYAQRWNEAFGCRINASRDNAVMLPRAAALPDPFAAIVTPTRLAPVVITKGATSTGSDVITVMTGTAGFGETASQVLTGTVTTNGLRLPNTLGLRGNDLLLLVESGLAGCMVQQVQAPFTGTSDQQVNLGGRYFNATGSTVNLGSFAGPAGIAYAIMLGNAADNAPQFQMFGVDANATLFSYDLLRISDTDAAVPLADGVVQIRALYGIDTNADGIQDAWVDPGTAPYDSASLLDGSPASLAILRRIVSVRVGLILRTSLVEQIPNCPFPAFTRAECAVTPDSLVLFRDLPPALQQTRPLTLAERFMRHRTVEFTIPLRNVLLLP